MTLKENPLYILKRMHFKVGRVISHQIILMTKRRILGKNDFWILKCKDPERGIIFSGIRRRLNKSLDFLDSRENGKRGSRMRKYGQFVEDFLF